MIMVIMFRKFGDGKGAEGTFQRYGRGDQKFCALAWDSFIIGCRYIKRCRVMGDMLALQGSAWTPGIATGPKMKGMAAEAATASGRGPELMSRCWPRRDTTPTAKSWGRSSKVGGSRSRRRSTTLSREKMPCQGCLQGTSSSRGGTRDSSAATCLAHACQPWPSCTLGNMLLLAKILHARSHCFQPRSTMVPWCTPGDDALLLVPAGCWQVPGKSCCHFCV